MNNTNLINARVKLNEAAREIQEILNIPIEFSLNHFSVQRLLDEADKAIAASNKPTFEELKMALDGRKVQAIKMIRARTEFGLKICNLIITNAIETVDKLVQQDELPF